MKDFMQKNHYATIIDMEEEENKSLQVELIVFRDVDKTRYDVND